MLDRNPPSNIEAERGVIAAALMDHSLIDDLAMIISPRDLWHFPHEPIWRAILDLHNSSLPVDGVSLAESMGQNGTYANIGGDEALKTIADSVAHAANARYHARVVREKAATRRMIQVANEIIAEGYSNTMTAQEFLDSAERKVFAVSEDQLADETLDGAALALEFAETQARREEGEIEGITTGFRCLDEALCGMRPGQLIILAARPGQGKTSLALNVAQHVTMSRGEAVLFVSLEMTRQDLEERWISSSSFVDSRRLRNPRYLEISERIAVSEAQERLRDAPIFINDTPAQTLSRIASNARRHKSKHGLSLLILDYLGYVNGEAEKGESVYAVVSRVSKGLKALAKELRIPLLVCHQLNRKSEDRTDQRPRMADLRDSGQIEADADVVILLHAKSSEGQAAGEVEVIIPKNRNGAPGVVRLAFNGPCTRFDMLARAPNGDEY